MGFCWVSFLYPTYGIARLVQFTIINIEDVLNIVEVDLENKTVC